MIGSISHGCLLLLIIPFVSSCISLRISPLSCIDKGDHNCTFGKLVNFDAYAGQYNSFQDIQFSETLKGSKIWSQLKWKAPLQKKVQGFLIILVNSTMQNYYFYNLTQDEILLNNSETIFSFTCIKDFGSTFIVHSGTKNFLAQSHRKPEAAVINTAYTEAHKSGERVITSTTTKANSSYATEHRKNTLNSPTNEKASYNWLIIMGGVLLVILVPIIVIIIRRHVSSKNQNYEYDSANVAHDKENYIKPNTSAEEPPEDDGISYYLTKINANNKTPVAKLPEEENLSYFLAKINANNDEKINICGNSYQSLDL